MNWAAYCDRFGSQFKILLSESYMLILFRILWNQNVSSEIQIPLQNKYVEGISDTKSNLFFLLQKWLQIN
jgi:hypothetical protein